MTRTRSEIRNPPGRRHTGVSGVPADPSRARGEKGINTTADSRRLRLCSVPALRARAIYWGVANAARRYTTQRGADALRNETHRCFINTARSFAGPAGSTQVSSIVQGGHRDRGVGCAQVVNLFVIQSRRETQHNATQRNTTQYGQHGQHGAPS